MKKLALMAAYLCITGFSGCWSVPLDLNPFDYVTAADSQWAVTMTNSSVQLHALTTVNTSTTVDYTKLACGFFKPFGDPQVVVDSSNRWWFAILVKSASQFPCNGPNGSCGTCLSVTAGTDPRGPYYSYYYNQPQDRPWLAVTTDKIAISGLWYNTVSPWRTLIINRAQALVAGSTPATATVITARGAVPAQNVSTAYPDLLFLINQSTACGNVTVTWVGGVPGSYVIPISKDVLVGYDLDVPPPKSSDPGGWSYALPGGTPPVFTGASLWIAHAGLSQCGAPSVPALALSRITGVAPLLQNPPAFAPALVSTAIMAPPDPTGSLGCPSLSVDAADRVLIGFSALSSKLWLTAYVTGRFPFDPPGTLRSAYVAQSGSGTFSTRIDTCMAQRGVDGTLWATQPFGSSILSNRFVEVTGISP